MAPKHELGPVPILLHSLMAKIVRGNWKMEDLVWIGRNAQLTGAGAIGATGQDVA